MLASIRRALLLRVFHLLYHQFAWAYDIVSAAVSLGRWQAWGRASLPFVTGPRVLELGHGPGHLLAALADRGDQPVGIDISPQMGRMARRRLRREGVLALLVQGRGQELPFAESTFDGIVAVFPAPYIVTADTAGAVWRVLKAGGKLVIVPEAMLTGPGLAARAIEWLYRITGQRTDPPARDSDPPGWWSRALVERGFHLAVYHVPQFGSKVTVIVANRPAD